MANRTLELGLSPLSSLNPRQNKIVDQYTAEIVGRLMYGENQTDRAEGQKLRLATMVRGAVAQIYYLSEDGIIAMDLVEPIRAAFKATLSGHGIQTRFDAERAEQVLQLRRYQEGQPGDPQHKIPEDRADAYQKILMGEPYQNPRIPVLLVGGNGVKFSPKQASGARKTGSNPIEQGFPELIYGDDGSMELFDGQLKERVIRALASLGITNWDELVQGTHPTTTIMKVIRDAFSDLGRVNSPEYQMFKIRVGNQFYNHHFRNRLANGDGYSDNAVGDLVAHQTAKAELANFVFGNE